MTRFIRWRYVAPRLLLLFVAYIGVEQATGWFAHWAMVRSGERAVGAKVEVGEVKASLLHTELVLRNLQIANPRKPMQNLVEAEMLALDFETNSLLRKKAIARQGVLRGLRLGTSRSESGALPAAPGTETAVEVDWLSDQAADLAARWLSSVKSQFRTDLVNELESVRLIEDLINRWPQKYAVLEQRVAELKSQSAELQQAVRAAETNPLRHRKFLESLPEQAATLEKQFQSLLAEIDALPSGIDADRRAIIAAKARDEELIRQKLHIDVVDSSALTAYFLRDQMAGPVADLVGWLRWARSVAPDQNATPQPGRGIDVRFAGKTDHPDFLIRTLELQGTARMSGQPLELSGQLTDLTTEPALHDRPIRLKLAASGALPLQLQATIDRTGDTPRDELLVDCEGFVLPKLEVGRANKLGLCLAPSTATLNVSLLLDGDRLSGDIQLVQKSVQITPQVDDQLASFKIDKALADSLRNFDSLATRITLGGTLDQPTWDVWSNLGPAVAEAMSSALERTLDARTEQVLAHSQRRVDEQFTKLDRLIADGQATLAPQLAGSTGHLKDLAAGEADQNLDQLGRRLPAGSLFR